jgi:hypothetical protein
LAGHLAASSGRIARPDDRDHRLRQEFDAPFHINERRRHAGVHECGGVSRLDREQRLHPQRARRRKLGFRFATRMDLHRLAPPTATRKVRQSCQRLLSAATLVDQFSESHGADVLGPNQAQAGKAFGVAEFRDRERCGAPSRAGCLTLWHRSGSPGPRRGAGRSRGASNR